MKPNVIMQQTTAQAFVERLADASVDCVITDPPHSGLEQHRAVGTTTRLKSRWFDTLSDVDIVMVLEALYPRLVQDAHLWVFADARLEYALVRALTHGRFGERRSGSYTCWGSWVWVKTGKMGMGYHGRRSHERILLFEKGWPKLNDRGVRDVIECPQPTAKLLDGREPYPTEKPVDLLRLLVRVSTEPGQLVVDPFAGSGSTGVAAVLEGRRFAGCDASPDAVALAQERLAAC